MKKQAQRDARRWFHELYNRQRDLRRWAEAHAAAEAERERRLKTLTWAEREVLEGGGSAAAWAEVLDPSANQQVFAEQIAWQGVPFDVVELARARIRAKLEE